LKKEKRNSLCKRRMEGTLFVYHKSKRLAAFQSGKHDRCLVFIGGLTDGFLPLSYLHDLAPALNSVGISLIQVLLSSSYNQYGTCSLQQDAEELDVLVSHLRGEGKFREVSLMGHSTVQGVRT